MTLTPRFLLLIAVSLFSAVGAMAAEAAPKTVQAVETSSQTEALPASQAKILADSIGEVEVERAIVLATNNPDPSELQNLNQRYVELIAQLQQLDPQNYQELASSAAQTALQRKIGEIEVERATASSRFVPDAPAIQDLDQQSVILESRLKELNPQNYLELNLSARQSALQQKITQLEAEYQQQEQVFVAEAPSLQLLRTTIQILQQRLDQVRSS